ncbi:hypothetical protein [Bartonella tribocorum]|uniref:Conjugal transfer protein TrbH n=1 Tax=Bartonella tribocorum TaxID=85701 RepID=A0A2M6UQK7_9HYPH|nr:hypothetical protein [Bartonella tribocorum]PIT68459.1 hypothetical protein CER18_06815 [Bartonella tribocorum]
MSKYLLPLPLMLVAGCASLNYSSSYVDQHVTQVDIQLIAHDFVRNLKHSLPPARTTLIVKKNKIEDNFTPLFIDLLQRNGYCVIYTDQPNRYQNGVKLTYQIMPTNIGILSTVYYDEAGVTRYYFRTYKR